MKAKCAVNHLRHIDSITHIQSTNTQTHIYTYMRIYMYIYSCYIYAVV
jgi:hypothetical protein